MKETRATNTTLPKGKEAMRLIGEMWSKLPVGRRRPVRSFTQSHRCRTASETFTRPHRKRKRAPTKIGQRSPGKNTNKNSPRITPTRKLRRKPTLRRPPRRLPPRSARSCVDFKILRRATHRLISTQARRARTAARRKRWRSGVDDWSLQIYVYKSLSPTKRFIYAISPVYVPHRKRRRARRRTRSGGLAP